MSLYGGIKFAKCEGVQESPEPTSKPQAVPEKEPAAESSAKSVEGTSSTPAAEKKTAGGAGEWSAALKFAPRIPKPKPSLSSIRPSFPTAASASTSTASSTPTAPAPTTTYSAAPVLNTQHLQSNTSTAGDEEIILGPDGRPLAKAPAMILSNKGAMNKRDRYGGQAGGEGNKRKKKKKKKNQQPLMPTFDPDEQYDPNRPNDLGEYKHYRQKVKEDRRNKYLEDKRRKAAGESSGESSYYTDSEEEVAPRRDAPKMFAPPKQYSPPTSARPLPPSQPAQSGDDAYARRAALTQASSGDDAYARRLALSQGQAVATPPGPPPQRQRPPSPPSDPYADRPAPPASTNTESLNKSVTSLSGAAKPFVPPSSALMAGAPHTAPPAPNFTPAAMMAPPAPGGPGDNNEFAKMLEERKRAAEAIAAKFRSLAGQGAIPAAGGSVPSMFAPASQPSEPIDESGTFAEKMMRKWGHKEGTGLGARGEGIVHALAAEHLEAAPKDPATMSKRQLAKQKAAAANAKANKKKWVQNPNTRGRIVNANEDERSKSEKEKYGEPSRVVCLIGLVGSMEDIDEDLAEEIGEECSKHGIVERVVLHMVEPPPIEPSECLRVFVVFSGMAGAWRNMKELDDRFFGGRKVRARYFDEAKFDSGDRDGDLA